MKATEPQQEEKEGKVHVFFDLSIKLCAGIINDRFGPGILVKSLIFVGVQSDSVVCFCFLDVELGQYVQAHPK